LNAQTTESQLTGIFSKYGKLEKVTIVYDAKTQLSRGFAFIYFVEIEVSFSDLFSVGKFNDNFDFFLVGS
jgi:RNA recognition motif-containing protein